MSRRTLSKRFKSNYPELQPLWIGLFIDILGFYIIIPLLPSIRDTFNTNDVMMGILVSINAIISLISAPIWGRLSDKFGRKYTLFTAESGTCLAFLILSLSNSLELLFISRVIDGIFGGNFPITKAIITDRVPPKDRSLQMTNFGVVHTLAGVIAPGLSGFLSYIPIFGPNYPVALPGLVAAALSLFTMIITLFYIEESWVKAERIKLKQQNENNKNPKINNSKDIRYVLTQYTFHTISFMLYVGPLSLFSESILGLDKLGTIIMLEISGISRAIVRYKFFKITMVKLGERKMAKFGLFILVLCFISLGILGLLYPEAWAFIIIMVLISYGVSCSRGLLISKSTKTVTPDKMGLLNGYTTTIDSSAQALGPSLGPFLYLINPLLYGLSMATFASGAFLMEYKTIIPLVDKIKKEKKE